MNVACNGIPDSIWSLKKLLANGVHSLMSIMCSCDLFWIVVLDCGITCPTGGDADVDPMPSTSAVHQSITMFPVQIPEAPRLDQLLPHLGSKSGLLQGIELLLSIEVTANYEWTS